MLRPDVSRRAADDIFGIWKYIAQFDVAAADRMVDNFDRAIDLLCEFPGIGHSRSDVSSPSVLFWAVNPYLIVYRREGRRLRVVRVLHGNRDIRKILG